jgi:uncharacterized membrane protein YGL010W
LSQLTRRSTVTWVGPLQNLLDDYAASHRNRTNNVLHWFYVPTIVWCATGLLWSLPNPGVNWASLAILAALIYYAVLSIRLSFGALPILAAFGSSMLLGASATLFVIAWIGLFIGHAIEGKRPSFLRDIQSLLIGPLWRLADLYRRFGVRY